MAENQNDLKDNWLSISILFIFIIALFTVRPLLDALPIKSEPFTDPPWYFIANDFKNFLASLIGILVIIILIGVAYRINRKQVFWGMFFTMIIFGNFLIKGLVVLANTQNIFNPELSTTNWTSFEEYMQTKNYASVVFLIVMVIVTFVVLFKRRWKTKAGIPE